MRKTYSFGFFLTFILYRFAIIEYFCHLKTKKTFYIQIKENGKAERLDAFNMHT